MILGKGPVSQYNLEMPSDNYVHRNKHQSDMHELAAKLQQKQLVI